MKKIAVFFILVTCLFFRPVFLKGWVPFPADFLVSFYAPWQAETSWPSKNQGHDVIRQLYPWKTLTLKMFREKQLPLWNPYAFAGNPHLANFQTAVFYPGNLLFLVFSQINAWTVLEMLQFLLAGFFTFALCKKWGLKNLAAVFSGVAFAFSLFMVVWSQWNTVGQVALWLPLILLSMEEILGRFNSKTVKTTFWSIIFIGSLVSSFFAGHIQVFIYILLVSGLYLVWRLFELKSDRLKIVLLFTFYFLLFTFVTSIQWIPTLHFYWQAPRSTVSSSYIFDKGLLPISHLVTLLAPDFFGNPATHNYFGNITYIEAVSYFGTMPFLLALFAIFWRREKRVFFWALIFFLSLLFSIKNPLSRWFYSLNPPVLGTSSPGRILFLSSFAGAILAGFGLDKILAEIGDKKLVKQILKLGLLIGLFYLFAWLWAFTGRQTVALRNLVLPSGFFLLALTILCLRRRILISLLLLITMVDLFYYGAKITPFVPRNLVFSQNEVFQFLKEKGGVERFFGFGGAYIDTNFATQYQVFNPEGYDPLFISRYGQLISAGKDGKIAKEIPRSDVNLEKIYPAETFATNPYRRRLFSLLGIKYIISKKEPLSSEVFNLVYRGKNFDIYEYKEALPRFLLAGDYLVEKDPQKIVDRIMDSAFPLRDEIILEESLPENFSLPKKNLGKIELLSYQENEIRFKTDSPADQLLFLSDNFYEGWRVTLDGQVSKIYRADFAFRAMAVPAGTHEIVFSYETLF